MPPERWTFLPTWAQLATVAHVSTMAPPSTNAPTIELLRDRYLTMPAPPPWSPPPPPTGSLVERLVRDASGSRALVLLKPNARGRTVSLGLFRNLHPLIDPDAIDDPLPLLDVHLERASWEENP